MCTNCAKPEYQPKIDLGTVTLVLLIACVVHVYTWLGSVLAGNIIDGGWSSWVKGACSITCGGEGMQVNTRTCDNPPPQNGGRDCNGTANRTEPCYTCPCKRSCLPVVHNCSNV